MPRDKVTLDFSEEPENVVMPFGKHAGEVLGNLPNTYLRWCIDEFDWEERQELIEAMQKVLDGRVYYIEDEYGN